MVERDRGFALLIVLWSVALLALLSTQVTSAGRNELQLAANIRNAAVAAAQADGLVYATIVRLMSDTAGERGVDGMARRIPVPGGQAVVTVTSQAGKVNPNTVSEAFLKALLQRVGLAAGPAANLAAAIADWRTPGSEARLGGSKAAQYHDAGLSYVPAGAPFASILELQWVLGMTPPLMERLMPHLTIFYPDDPVLAAADPLVASVLKQQGAATGPASAEGLEGDSVYAEIAVQVTAATGAVFVRRAIVWAGHGSLRGRYQVLSWDSR